MYFTFKMLCENELFILTAEDVWRQNVLRENKKQSTSYIIKVYINPYSNIKIMHSEKHITKK